MNIYVDGIGYPKITTTKKELRKMTLEELELLEGSLIPGSIHTHGYYDLVVSVQAEKR